MPKFSDRLQHAWNAFRGRDSTEEQITYNIGYGDYRPPDKKRMHITTERTTINAIYNRIAVDAAACAVKHVRVNEDDQYQSVIDSDLNWCLNIMANKDQTGRAFIQDAVMSMLDEGYVALVITDASISPRVTESYKIKALRTARIVEWFPDYVKVDVYNETTGKHQQIVVPKTMTAIVENPFYSVMNEPNSTAKRLMRKINLLDTADENQASNKLDLIIQLPYVVKTEAKRQQAEQRRQDIEMQLSEGKYGIAYTDGTERITQLNRAVENNLPATIKDLTTQLYSQLSMTEEVMLGTAKEEVMLNYYNRTIEPIMSAITDAMKCKFLSKTAITQGQSIKFFRAPFKLAPVNQIAEIADKFTRNEILTPNELRSIVGFKPVEGQGADELRNRNINQNAEEVKNTEEAVEQPNEEW